MNISPITVRPGMVTVRGIDGVDRFLEPGDVFLMLPDPVLTYLTALALHDREDADAEWAKLNYADRERANAIVKGILAHGAP